MINNDTICALSTSPGNGAIAIIRLSGSESFAICDKIFSAKNKTISNQKANSIVFGEIKDGNDIVDEVLVSIFKAPHSYTGEDTVEISCHGSVYIQQKILELLVKSSARMAQPGEYTMRAFLNNKLDLSQAEGVADLIASNSKASHKVAINQMRGGFSSEIADLRKQLLGFVSLLELELDFSEEDIEFADRGQMMQLIDKVNHIVSRLIKSFELGNAIKNGIPIAIIGEPNVGKSTLLNQLLNENKAIVSDIPGTTRDVIEDVINIDGVLFRFIDTAGIRSTTDAIEKLGIDRTFEKINQARIILLLIDVNKELSKNEEIINEVRDHINEDQLLFIVGNKIDSSIEKIDDLKIHKNEKFVRISAKNNKNIELLVSELKEIIISDNTTESDVIINNVRHFESLTKVKEGIDRVEAGLNSNLSNDFLAQDVREILYYLGEITGEITTDEILGNIFSSFCIGK